ncbi:hypothetical protein [Vibrio mexicanus]|uniref:hypothetical protein n=1 Tax=Vibrio mexicanus TaxID=1004326 RepID=UPI00063C5F6E|nr:hypothetical protein [Vibrio mexicanus]
MTSIRNWSSVQLFSLFLLLTGGILAAVLGSMVWVQSERSVMEVSDNSAREELITAEKLVFEYFNSRTRSFEQLAELLCSLGLL